MNGFPTRRMRRLRTSGALRDMVADVRVSRDGLIAPLVESFATDYDISGLVERMLRSNLFFSRFAYRQRIKCPVEFALGIVKGMEGMVSTTRLGEDIAGVGQNLCYPPTVNGWSGGECWIDNATLVGRCNLAAALLEGAGDYGKKLDPWRVAGTHKNSTVDSAGRFLTDLFLQGDIPSGRRESLRENAVTGVVKGDSAAIMRQLAYSIVTLPEFHLA